MSSNSTHNVAFSRASDSSYSVILFGEVIIGHVTKNSAESTHPWGARNGHGKVCSFRRTRAQAAEALVEAHYARAEEQERDRLQWEVEAEEAAKPRRQTRLSEALDAASGLQGDIGQATGQELLDLSEDAKGLEEALVVLLLRSTTASYLRQHDPEAYEQAKAALVAAGVSI